MNALANFTVGAPSTIAAIGGIEVGGNTLSNQFMNRFGSSWRKAPGGDQSNKIYVIFDKIDDAVCFAMTDNVIKAYPNVSKAEFIQAWKDDWCRVLNNKALTFNIDSKMKYTGLQVMQIYNSLTK